MDWIIGGGVLPTCLVVGWLILRRPLRQLLEALHAEKARELFRPRREWLEARFISALGKTEPSVAQVWEEAQWQNEVHWARDRKSRSLLALVGVNFEPSPFDHEMPRHSTAIFEFRKGQWRAEGKRLDETRPAEALLRHQRFEPVVPPKARA